MPAIHDHETHNETLHVTSRPPTSATRLAARALLEWLPIPLGFALLLAGWPLVIGGPAPWWVWVGLVWYAGLVGAGWGHVVYGNREDL